VTTKYVYLIPRDELMPTDQWCDKHLRSKTAVAFTSITDDGVDGDAGRVTYCDRCVDEQG
jgi:hypothetical protein